MLLLELSHLAGPGEAVGRSYWPKAGIFGSKTAAAGKKYLPPDHQEAFRCRSDSVSSVREACEEDSLPRFLLVGNNPAPYQTDAIITTETTTAQKRTFRKSPNAISIPDHQPFLIIGIPIACQLGVYFVLPDSSPAKMQENDFVKRIPPAEHLFRMICRKMEEWT